MQTAPQGDSDLQHKNITRFNNAQKAKIRILLLLRDIKAFFTAFLPAMLGASSAQIIAIIDSSLVTLLPDSEGGVSVLNFANRIFQLPLALFAIAISSALFPMVAKAIKVRDTQNALHALKAAFWFLLITLSICTIGGIMLRNEIIWLLFERGNFTHKDTIMVGYAFVGYMIGLIPFGLARIFSLWLYSHKKQAKAAKISVIALFIGVMLSAIFILSIYYFEIQSGIIWELRYCFMALFGSIGGFALLFFNIKEFGVYNFFVIISHTKYMLLLCGASFVTFVLIKLFQCFFSIK
ncbi:hypothetical protein CQA53_07795 [Helicobacter didelphidarum]|uniref:Virulence factor MviN n=2 Tax=Helicobacter didelphidarum TaxID=2040648 RepID=A0A3D8II56_9HELI|nr:hypothetical protein CQA53_07795 [Helicobacter didelphidarum]